MSPPTKARQNDSGSGISRAEGQVRGHADGVEMPAGVNVEHIEELVNEDKTDKIDTHHI